MATWYVRPDTSHSATRNGTSYDTAWGGWSAIVWGGAGVVGGDTLYICGEHARSTTTSVGAHGGTEGNEAVLRGDYENDPGHLVMSGSTNLTARSHTQIIGLEITQGTVSGVFINGHTNVLLERMVFNGVANVPAINCSTAVGVNTADIAVRYCTFNNVGYALRWLATTATATTATLNGLVCEYNTVTHHPSNTGSVGGFEVRMESGVDAACFAQNIRFSRNRVSGPGRAFVTASGGGPPPATDKFTNITVADNEAFDVFVGVMLYGSTANNFVLRNRVRNTSGLSGGLDMMSVGSALVEGNDFYGHTTTDVDGNSAIIGDLSNNVIVRFNRFGGSVGNEAVVNSGASLMLNACNNVSVYSNLLYGSRYGLWVNDNRDFDGFTALNVSNNTISAKERAIYLRRITSSPADIGELTLRNNLLLGEEADTIDLTNDWPGVPEEDYTHRWGVIASGFLWGANGSTADPQVSAFYIPRLDSPLLTQGADLGHRRDIRGFQSRKHIGAYGAAKLMRQR